MFFFKSKEIHLDCFVYRDDVHDFFPIDYSHKFFPQWWKDLPKYNPPEGRKRHDSGTMKMCVGLTEYYKNSFMIPMWTDMLITPAETGFNVDFSDRITKGGSHDIIQMGNLIDPDEFAQFKITCPWFLKCKDDIKFAWSQPIWNFSKIDQIIVPPGILDYKYQRGSNINIFFPMGKRILIESGQPLVNVRPITEKKLKLHRHLVSVEEMDKVSRINASISFVGKYNKIKQIIKKQESEKKCPFGFGK
jgi:hypothetical protein